MVLIIKLGQTFLTVCCRTAGRLDGSKYKNPLVLVLTLGCQFLSPLAEDIERLVLLYWYLPIHQSYLTFDKLDTGLSWDISRISKYHQKMAERKMEKNHFSLIISTSSSSHKLYQNNKQKCKWLQFWPLLVWAMTSSSFYIFIKQSSSTEDRVSTNLPCIPWRSWPGRWRWPCGRPWQSSWRAPWGTGAASPGCRETSCRSVLLLLLLLHLHRGERQSTIQYYSSTTAQLYIITTKLSETASLQGILCFVLLELSVRLLTSGLTGETDPRQEDEAHQSGVREVGGQTWNTDQSSHRTCHHTRPEYVAILCLPPAWGCEDQSEAVAALLSSLIQYPGHRPLLSLLTGATSNIIHQEYFSS